MTKKDSANNVWTLEELAQLVGGHRKGEASKTVSRIAELHNATPDAVSHCSDDLHAKYLSTTSAGILILPQDNDWNYNGDQLLVENSRAAFGVIVEKMYKPDEIHPGVHHSAVIGENADIAASACIQANVTIGHDVQIAEGVQIGAGSVIGDHVTIGHDTEIEHNVTVYRHCIIGRHCCIYSGTVIGASGFSYVWIDSKWIKIMNVGAVEIGDDVDIGACCTIDRGSIENTRISDGVKIDNNVQIGHNCDIGDHTLIVANVGIAGSATIGKRCTIAGHVAIGSHVEVADDITILAGSIVTKSLKKSATYGATIPVREARQWNKTLAKLNRL